MSPCRVTVVRTVPLRAEVTRYSGRSAPSLIVEDGLGDQEADTGRPVVSRRRVNVLAVARSHGADIVSVVVVFPDGSAWWRHSTMPLIHLRRPVRIDVRRCRAGGLVELMPTVATAPFQEFRTSHVRERLCAGPVTGNAIETPGNSDVGVGMLQCPAGARRPTHAVVLVGRPCSRAVCFTGRHERSASRAPCRGQSNPIHSPVPGVEASRPALNG